MPTEATNVSSIRDFLVSTLEHADEIDRDFHRLRDELRRRVVALDLAQDDDFVKRAREAEDVLRSGATGITRDEFAARFVRR